MGETGSGKTFKAAQWFRECPHAAIFLNVGLETESKYWADTPITTDPGEALKIIFNGGHVVLNIQPWGGRIETFMERLVHIQVSCPSLKPISVFLDECHKSAPSRCFDIGQAIQKGEAPNIWLLTATEGRHWNIQMWWISQRSQLVDSTLVRECGSKVFFRLDPLDMEYWRRVGIVLTEKENYEYEIL